MAAIAATALDLPDAEIAYTAQFLAPDQADALQASLRDAIPWEQHRIRLFGRWLDAPRQSCWIGDPGCAYTYSRVRHEPRPWPAPLDALRARLAQATGIRFNAVLANRYRDGRDAMGWHADDEPELGPRPLIASISLGAPRRFLLRHRLRRDLRAALTLDHGSLLLMAGDTQRCWQHSLPRSARPLGERINLTFRRILGPSTPSAG